MNTLLQKILFSIFISFSLFLSISTNTSAQTANSCSVQQPTMTRLKLTGTSNWSTGTDITNAKPLAGQKIDVRCFAKNGTTLLPNSAIHIKQPNGDTTIFPGTDSELGQYQLQSAGIYTVICQYSSDDKCTTQETFTVLPNPSFTPQPTATPATSQATCNSLQIVSGNDTLVPANVTLKVQGTDPRGNIQGYRFYFGDGTRIDSTNPEVTHQYAISGTFTAVAELKDSAGNYVTSNSCETQVKVKSSSIESSKSECSDLFITTSNSGKAPTTVNFKVSGYDNKGSIQNYKLDFGNGVVQENDSSNRSFDQIYDKSGTYQVKAYIKNSAGQWVGGTNYCSRALTIGSNEPLRRQPSTGSPTPLLMLGLICAVAGVSFELARRRQTL